MQITDLIRDSPWRDLGTVLGQCTHVVVPRDQEESFEYLGRLQAPQEGCSPPGRVIVFPGGSGRWVE